MKQEDKRLLRPCAVVAAILICALLLSTLLVTERGVCSENISWKLHANGRLKVEGSGMIPDYNTEADDPSPFYRRSVVNATLENGIASVGAEAFYKCLNMRSITLPQSVLSIGDLAFYGCDKLKTIDIDKNNPAYIFENGSLITADGSELLFHSPKASGKEYTVPETVNKIDAQAFHGCKTLKKITLSAGVNEIGDGAFTGCTKLAEIAVPERSAYAFDNGMLFNSAQTELIFCAPANGNGDLSVPEGVTSIRSEAFSGCRTFTEIALPAGLQTVGDRAFSGCSGLTKITLPASLNEIGDGAFTGCTKLTEIVLPENGNFIFADGALTDKSANALLFLAPAAQKDSFTLPENITAVGTRAFSGCSKLKSVTLPAGLKEIGDQAFYGCSNLGDIYFKGSEAAWNAIPGHTEALEDLKDVTVHFE